MARDPGAGIDVDGGLESDIDRPVANATGNDQPGQSPTDLFVQSPLEGRYRRLLQVVPADYRALREQEMVDTFLVSRCAANPELADLTMRLGWPGAREVASVLGLAVRVRWLGVAAPERARVRAGALHIAVLAALTVLAVLAASALLNQICFAAGHPEYGGVPILSWQTVDALWAAVQDWSYLFWIVALVAVLSGRPRWAQWLSAVPLTITVIATVDLPWSVESWPILASCWALILIESVVLVGLTSFAHGAPVANHRRWMTAAAAGILALSAIGAATVIWPDARFPLGLTLIDESGLWCAAATVAAVVLFIRRARGARIGTEWMLALAGLAGAAALLRAGNLAIWAMNLPWDSSPAGPILIAGSVQLFIAAAIATVTGMLGARRFRRLPSKTR